ncbi:MAG: hypothetical protein PF572_05775 [Patescibacteria group bacterium]|jgi:hypothetical protein|nr:hypothetical protein [Patescibacteria group bacterium]
MTFQDLIDTENELLLKAKNEYDKEYINCLNLVSLLQNFIKSTKLDSWLFNIFLSYIRKHIVLSFFSTLRLHHVQSDANLRQALEATSLACYSLVHTEKENFMKDDKNFKDYILNKSYKWLEQKYPDASKAIKISKDQINSSCSHASLAYAFQEFQLERDKFSYSFFDKDDKDLVKAYLWNIAHISGNIMDIIYGVNRDSNMLIFTNDFISKLREYRKINDEIKAESLNKEKFKKHLERPRQ